MCAPGNSDDATSGCADDVPGGSYGRGARMPPPPGGAPSCEGIGAANGGSIEAGGASGSAKEEAAGIGIDAAASASRRGCSFSSTCESASNLRCSSSAAAAASVGSGNLLCARRIALLLALSRYDSDQVRTRERHQATKTAPRRVAAPLLGRPRCAKMRARAPGGAQRMAVSNGVRVPYK